MDIILTAVLNGVAVFLSILGLAFLMDGFFPRNPIDSCNMNGYWQTGKTRIICYVEEKNE